MREIFALLATLVILALTFILLALIGAWVLLASPFFAAGLFVTLTILVSYRARRQSHV